MRRIADVTQATIDKLMMQLAQLSTQLDKFSPARKEDVATGQAQLS